MKYFYVVAFCFLLIVITPYIFKINKVYCSNQFGKCSPEITERLSSLENLTYKNLDNQIKSFLDGNSLVEEYSYFFVPPATLKVNLIERVGLVAIATENNSVKKIVDENLNIIFETEDTQLPIIFVEEDEVLSKETTKFAVELMVQLARYYSVKEAILAENLKIVYDGSTEIIFPSEGDVDVLLGTLEIMLFQLNQRLIDSKISLRAQDVKMIDLRNKNPIIK